MGIKGTIVSNSSAKIPVISYYGDPLHYSSLSPCPLVITCIRHSKRSSYLTKWLVAHGKLFNITIGKLHYNNTCIIKILCSTLLLAVL